MPFEWRVRSVSLSDKIYTDITEKEYRYKTPMAKSFFLFLPQTDKFLSQS